MACFAIITRSPVLFGLFNACEVFAMFLGPVWSLLTEAMEVLFKVSDLSILSKFSVSDSLFSKVVSSSAIISLGEVSLLVPARNFGFTVAVIMLPTMV